MIHKTQIYVYVCKYDKFTVHQINVQEDIEPQIPFVFVDTKKHIGKDLYRFDLQTTCNYESSTEIRSRMKGLTQFKWIKSHGNQYYIIGISTTNKESQPKIKIIWLPLSNIVQIHIETQSLIEARTNLEFLTNYFALDYMDLYLK